MNAAQRAGALVAVSVALAVALVVTYLAAGGASYTPAKVEDPCDARAWRDPGGLQEAAEQFTLSALDGAACKLRVSRETLARGLATEQSRQAFARRYRIDDETLELAVRAGVVRAIDDAERAGALPGFLAGPLRAVAVRLPVDETIGLINDARPFFEDPQKLLQDPEALLDLVLPGR